MSTTIKSHAGVRSIFTYCVDGAGYMQPALYAPTAAGTPNQLTLAKALLRDVRAKAGQAGSLVRVVAIWAADMER
jgi:hypothetical protein